MNDDRFDTFARNLAATRSRRRLLRTAVGSALGGLGVLVGLAGAASLVEDEVAAADRQERPCPRARRCKRRCCRPGQRCQGGRCVRPHSTPPQAGRPADPGPNLPPAESPAPPETPRAPNPPPPPNVAPPAPKTPDLAIRREVWSLTAAQMTALQRGVVAMRQRPPSDPTSWQFQANIHGTNDGANGAWNQCQHGGQFFLAWHRMYLYWFERILRAASGDPTLALPYWDYSIPERRILPPAFRDPESSLFVEDRNRGVNAGVPPSRLDHIFDHSAAFGATLFTGTGTEATFGGGDAARGLLESTPHNNVHSWLGSGTASGRAGWMGSTAMAARDPVFWLHHANVDRLWERWLDLGGGRANPADGAWLNQTFAFFDEGGRRVTMSGQAILDTVGQLRYRYDDGTVVASASAARSRLRSRTARSSIGDEGPMEELGASDAPNGIALTGSPVTVSIAIGAETPTAESALTLSVEGVRGTGVPGVAYEVYVDLPAGAQADPAGVHYVGLIGLFGLQPGDAGPHAHHGGQSATQRFDLSRHAAGPSGRDRLDVTFVPLDLSGLGSVPAGPIAEIERVRVFGT